ncbi:MAG: glutathione S-transferase family protein [Solirubrobacteraceae bacterium]|nr:glutathione S-transferase family protein [Solirubrobacteraceae bacterium]
MPDKVRFYGFTGSNSVYTGRLLLEHKGLEYRFVKLPPAAHAFILLALGFPTMGAPALKIGGRRVSGTRWIARALDELYPDDPLFPADAELRREVQRAERWGEELQNATRRTFYSAARRDRDAFMSVLGSGRGPVRRAGLRLMSPIIIRLATGVHRASDDAAREDIELLPERLDQIDAWIAAGVLNGESLNAADYQIAVNVSALLLCDDFIPFVDGRPAAELARRVAPDYVGHLDPVVPDEWMAELRTAYARSAAGAGAVAPAPNGTSVADSDATRVASLMRASL